MVILADFHKFIQFLGLIHKVKRFSLYILTLGVRVDPRRAREDLGYTTRPIRETLADLADWYRANGYA